MTMSDGVSPSPKGGGGGGAGSAPPLNPPLVCKECIDVRSRGLKREG